jgi:hypothetical protein
MLARVANRDLPHERTTELDHVCHQASRAPAASILPVFDRTSI